MREIAQEITRQTRRLDREAPPIAHLQLGEAKPRYEAHFTSKPTDSDDENAETDTWLDFAMDCGHLDSNGHERLAGECRSVGKMIGAMLNGPEKFLLK